MDIILSQTQKLTITPQMIQSMQVLQLNAMELKDYLEEMALSNPLLEIDENEQHPADSDKADIARKLEWLSTTDRQNRVYYDDDYSENLIENTIDHSHQGDSIHDYLRAQIIAHDYDKKQRTIINFLIECIDSRGYLAESPKELSAMIGEDEKIISDLIEDIKALDPAGVGAKDLTECLLLQLERLNANDITKTIVRDHLQKIGKQHFRHIAKELDIPIETVDQAVELIRSLSPKPASSFASREKLRYISPDAVIVREGGQFTILINEFSYPRISINSYYESLLKTTTDKETVAYLKERIEKVKKVQADLLTRTSTLSKVCHSIVEHQLAFFLNGPGFKRPLYLSTLADELGLHVSTISRALSGKYLQCSYGVYPLNFFLTPAATKNTASGADMTKEDVYTHIKQIISEEDKKKPLSDDAIAKELSKFNIDISRRTVNKYRGLLGIPDKSARKEF